MNTWIFLVLVYLAAIELVCILILVAVIRLMAKEIKNGRQIMPVEVRKKREVPDTVNRPEPYWIGPGDPEEDDGR